MDASFNYSTLLWVGNFRSILWWKDLGLYCWRKIVCCIKRTCFEFRIIQIVHQLSEQFLFERIVFCKYEVFHWDHDGRKGKIKTPVNKKMVLIMEKNTNKHQILKFSDLWGVEAWNSNDNISNVLLTKVRNLWIVI